MSHLKSVDPKVFELIKEEEKRQREVLEMIPSENYASGAVAQKGRGIVGRLRARVLSAPTIVSFSSDTTSTSMSHPNLTIGRINLDIIK